MKVVHICTSLTGGAGLCARRIICATRTLGIDAKVVVAYGNILDEDWISIYDVPYPWSKFKLIHKIQTALRLCGLWPFSEYYSYRILEEQQKNHSEGICVTSPVTRYKKLHEHPWVKEADIVHLHWVGSFMDYKSFFNNIKKPIVWTIHDENPGLGGFHYTSWLEASSESFKALDTKLASIKRRAYRHVSNMTLVAISSMMKSFFETNNILKSFPISLIHNGIEIDKFRMLEKRESRKLLEIPYDAIVFSFAAQDIYEGRKGLRELISAIAQLNSSNVFLVCIGGYGERIPEASFPVKCVGFISDPAQLSICYSSSDFFVMSSYQEAFSQTPLEALACGVPVVSTPVSGASDLIRPYNGIVCSDFSAESIADGIRVAMNRNYDSSEIIKDVTMRFSYDKIACQYLELYESVLHQW